MSLPLARLVCLGVVTALLAAAAVPPAAAQPGRTAPDGDAPDAATLESRRHFERAEKLFALGRFEDALAAYGAAYEAKQLPGLLFNIAQCHRNLGHYTEAIFGYRQYLRLTPDAPNRDAVLRLIDELEGRKRAEDEQRRQEEEAAAAAAARALAAQPPPASARPRPIYGRWWFWTGVAVVAGGAAAGSYLLLRSNVPGTELGDIPVPPP